MKTLAAACCAIALLVSAFHAPAQDASADAAREELRKLEQQIQVRQERLRLLQEVRDAEARLLAFDREHGIASSSERRAAYLAATSNAIRRAWVRPDDTPTNVVCAVRITQQRGGIVTRVAVSPDCPYDALTRQSVEAAVLKASPLPYEGFEDVFMPDIVLRFRAEDEGAGKHQSGS